MPANFNTEDKASHSAIRFQHSTLRVSVRLALFLAAVIALNAGAAAQTAPARPDRGINPGGSYAISDIENINMSNGNVGVSIPLASLPPIAGGKLGNTIRAVYNSKLWDVVRKQVQPNPVDPASAYQTNKMQLSDLNGGWIIGGGYSIYFFESHDDFDWPLFSTDPEYDFLFNHNFWKCTLTTPDGSQHELRPVDFSPYTDQPLGHHPNLKGCYTDYPGNKTTPMRFYSYDGSYLWATIDPMPAGSRVPASWIVYMPDGSSVSFNNGVQKIRDTNGNRVDVFQTEDLPGVFTTHYVDHQTLREIQFVYDTSNPANPVGHVKYQTVLGGWATIDINYRQTLVSGQAYLIGDTLCPDAALLADTSIQVLDSIVLPQTEQGPPQRRFTFTYNSDSNLPVSYAYRLDCTQNPPTTVTSASRGFGSLASITLPTDARVDYSYFLDIDVNGLPTVPLQNANDLPRERIVKKTVTHDGILDVWNYSISSGFGSVTGPDGSSVIETGYPHEEWLQHLYGGEFGKGGLVYRTNQSNKVIIERHWIHNSFGTNPGAPAQATGSAEFAAFNAVVDYEYTTLLDQSGVATKISTKAMQYDFNGNLKSVTEYDFVDNPNNPSIVPRDPQGIPMGIPTGAVALRTTTNTYCNPADTGTSSNIYANRLTDTATPLVLNAPRTSVTGPSQSEFYYDGSLNLDTAPTKGNLTKERHFVEGTTWVQTTHIYDPVTGNLTSSTDPKGNLTQFFYDDLTFALPTRVVADPLNGTGSQTTSTIYDFSTGLPLSVTDPNNRTTSTDYHNQLLVSIDPFNRPGIVTNAQGRTTVARYRDNAKQVEMWSDLATAGDAKLRTRTTADQLGRPITTESAEDGVNYTVSADTVYQQMGKLIITTNPMRAQTANTDGWTQTTKDNAGRVVTVETFSDRYPSGTSTGVVSTSYNANATTVTDQAGKVRRSITDGLGRLIRIDEPNSSGALDDTTVNPPVPTQPTSYTYDTRANLTQVAQGGQTRTFVYDGLSRLKQATNPESGAINYTYDDDGNLQTKTDARGVITTFTYDGLSRVLTRTYSGAAPGPSTPAVTYTYDTLGAALNGIGRLTSVNSSVSSYSYGSYDVVGRVLTGTQTTDGQNYGMSYQYNLAGGMTSETYPSNKVVVTEFDTAGRIAGVKKDATTYYAGGAAGGANAMSYTAHGAAATMRLGNGKWEHTNFNSRLQPEQIGLGTSGTDSGTLRLDYTYDELNRLKTANESSGANWSQTYDYDRYGNRAVRAGSLIPTPRQTPTSNSASDLPTLFSQGNNRVIALTGLPTTEYGYDAAGNLTSMPDKVSGPSDTMTYDAENRQLTFNGTVGQYFYDGDGHRVKKIDGLGTTIFVYNAGGQLIAEYHSDPVPPAAGGGGTSYLTSDHLGSTRVVTRADGSVKARYDYVPFGEELGSGIGGRTALMGYSAADSTKQKFTRKQRDSESGLDYFLARYYSSAQGRFTSADPYDIIVEDEKGDESQRKRTFNAYIFQPQNWNKYAYVLNNPLRYVDPDGRDISDVLTWTVEFLENGGAEITITGLGAAAASGAGEGAVVVIGSAILGVAVYDLLTTGNELGSRGNTSRAATRSPHEIATGNASRGLPTTVHLTRQQEAIKRATGIAAAALAHVGFIQNGKPNCPPGSQCYKDNVEKWKGEIKTKIKELETQAKRARGKAKDKIGKIIQELTEFIK